MFFDYVYQRRPLRFFDGNFLLPWVCVGGVCTHVFDCFDVVTFLGQHTLVHHSQVHALFFV